MRLDPVDVLHVAIHLKDRRVAVGRLANYRGQVFFEYDQAFLDLGIQISPFKLPVQRGAIPCEGSVFEGLFGVFNDSLPDGWGRLLLDRAVQAHGIAHQRLTPLDRLAHVGEHAMGALLYTPDYSSRSEDEEYLDLTKIEQEVNKVLEGEPTDLLHELLELGGSSAGARPKILVGYDREAGRLIHGAIQLPDGYDAWMVKFPSSLDQQDIANIEYAYSLMAKAAGLDMPPTHLFEGKGDKAYFGVKRFDRVGHQRVHMHTAAGLLHADHRIPSLDYENLMRAAMALTKNMAEVQKVFRLAVFNVLAHNRDDHSKNFSFLMDSTGNWTFAPAYDLTFSYGPGREHSSMVMGEGRNPGGAELRQLGEKFQVQNPGQVIEEVRGAVARWEEFATTAGVSKSSMQIIKKTLMTIH